MSHSHFPLLRTLSSALLAAGLLTAVPPAQALNQFLKTWEDTYPDSKTDNASCSLCHGTANTNLNAYGKDLCDAFGGSLPADIVSGLRAIEDRDSDEDSTDSNNMTEINADAQPGWTVGANNKIYAADVGGGCAYIGVVAVPSNVPLPYDPPVNGEPVAVPGGPYSGYVNVPLTSDGSGSYDSDETDVIASYTWDFGDGTSGTGVTPQHTYTVDGNYTVTLTVVDDEGDNNTHSTTAAISGAAVLDLDIAAFKVSKTASVGRPISIQLSVENPGTVLGQALATVVGTQNGEEVYRWNLNVYDYNGKGATSFAFPTYKPTAKGIITWNAIIADVAPDRDQTTVVTIVK